MSATPSTNTAELIQFVMMHAELEDKRHNDKEGREERRAYQQEEAEELQHADEAEERREHTTMMQSVQFWMALFSHHPSLVRLG